MMIRVNGEEQDIAGGMTLGGLLACLDVKLQGVAVDVNKEIVPRRLYDETILREGDRVEIVRMAGGG